MLLADGRGRNESPNDSGRGRKEIAAFNIRLVELHLKMHAAGVLALWAEDGVDLMPGDGSVIGKKKIVA
ncbi:MAG: hypothetical protein DMG49_15925 [Acidobacteria bacterium]|nr:MAG: hypothetical protein DMG49_15925 [Acidobacteriota bacterium]